MADRKRAKRGLSEGEPSRETRRSIKRSLGRRILRVVLIVVAVPLVLLLVALLALHSGPGQTWLRSKIQARAAERLNGSLVIGKLDVALFGDIVIGGVKVSDEAGEQVLALESLEVSLDWGSLLSGNPVIERVALDGVDLHIVQDEDGGSNLKKLVKPKPPEPEPPEPPKKRDTRIRVNELLVSNIDVTIDKPDGTRIAVRDFGLQASIDAIPSKRTLKVSLPDLHAGFSLDKAKDGLKLAVRDITTAIDVDVVEGAGQLTVSRTQAKATLEQKGAPPRSADLDLAGLAVDVKPGELGATLDQLVIGALVLQSLEVRGSVDQGQLDGDQKVQIIGLKVDAKRLNALLGKDLLATDIDLETKIGGPPEKIALLTTITTGGGQLRLEGTVDASDMGQPRYDIKLLGADFASDKLVSSDKVPPVELGKLQLGVRGAGLVLEDVDTDVGLRLGPVRVGKYTLDDLLLQAHVDGAVIEIDPLRVEAMGQKVFVRGTYDLRRKAIAAQITVDGDVGQTLERLRKAGLDIKTQLPRGAIDLHEGVVTIDIEGELEGALTADVVIHDAPVAGGAIATDMHATLHRNLDAGPDDKKVVLDSLDGVVELKHVNLKQVLALRGKQLKGLTGTVSGKIVIEGAPSEPTVTYDLSARAQANDSPTPTLHEPTLVLTAKGKGTKQGATLDLVVMGIDADKKMELLTGKVSVPLIITDEHRGLAPNQPLVADLTIEERSLEQLRPFLPQALLVDAQTGKPKKLPNGSLAATIKLRGTGAAPQGTIHVDVKVPALGGKMQRLDVDGRVATDAKGQVALDTDLKGWLDSAGETAIDGHARVELSHSPLLAGPRTTSWAVNLEVKPQRLDQLPAAKALGVSGTAGAKIDVRGNQSDVLGTVNLALSDVKAMGKGPIDAKVGLDVGPQDTGVDVKLAVSKQPILSLEGKVGRSGTGLLSALRDKTPGKSTVDKLGNPSLDLTLEIPRHSLMTYAMVQPQLAALPGTLGGRIDVGGDLKTPTAKGEIAYQDFDTLAGTQGRVAVEIDAGTERLAAKLQLGPPTTNRAPVEIAASVPRAAVPKYLAAKKCFTAGGDSDTASCPKDGKMPIDAHVAAADVDVKTLVPAFAIDDKNMVAGGKLSWSLDGNVVLDPEPRYAEVAGERKELPPIAPESELSGKLALTEGIVGIPGTSRRYHDIALRLSHDLSSLTIDGISARESDRQRKDRKLDVTGRLALKDLQPTELKLQIDADEWLVFGQEKVGPADAPRGTLTASIAVDGQLDRPVKVIDVNVASLELLIPDRFNRAHQPEEVSLGDVIYLDESGQEPGKLPVTLQAVEAEDAFANEKPKGPERGLDVHVRIPKKIHVLQDPMNLYAVGEIAIKRRDAGRTIDGKLTMVGGDLSLGGKKHPLTKGSIVFDEAHPGGEMDLNFGRREHNTMLRSVSKASAGDLVTIRLQGPISNRRTTLGGAGSPGTLYDLLSVHNAGRPRYASEPDMPATNTVQFPQHDNLLMLSYLSVNVPHLLFLDKVAAWADAYDDRGTRGYGQVRHYESEGYNEDGDMRVRMVGRPRGAGQSAAEVQLDYLFMNTPQTAVGVGVGAGSRLGGGPGIFFEWSSKD